MKITSTLVQLTILGILGVLLIAQPAHASMDLEACDVPLTELGRRSYFSLQAIYEIVTGDSGVPVSLRQPMESELGRFVVLDNLETCIMRWKLEPNTKYSLVFQAGTTGQLLTRWRLIICEAEDNCIAISLPQARAGKLGSLCADE